MGVLARTIRRPTPTFLRISLHFPAKQGICLRRLVRRRLPAQPQVIDHSEFCPEFRDLETYFCMVHAGSSVPAARSFAQTARRFFRAVSLAAF
jgi:hypothetical protein